MIVAVVPTVTVDGELHEDIVGGLLPPEEVTIICPQDLDDDAPLESVAVIVTVNVPVPV